MAASRSAGTALAAGPAIGGLGPQVQRLGRGLLARAEGFRSGANRQSQAAVMAPLQPDEKASLGKAVGGGLLARAERMRNEAPALEKPRPAAVEPEQPVAAAPMSSMGSEPSMPDPDRPLDLSLLGPEELDQGDVSAPPQGDEEVIIDALGPEDLWESDAESLSSPETPATPATAPIDTARTPEADEWPELPTLEDLELEDVPARSESLDEDVVLADTSHEDPFADWEDRAAHAAASAAADVVAESASGKSAPATDRYLFADDEFSTRPVEANIAGQRKIDNYLALFDITKELAATDSVAALWETILYGVMGQVGAETICIFSSIRERNGKQLFPVAHSGFELTESWAFRPGDVIYEKCRKADGVRYAEEFLGDAADTLSDVERSVLRATGAKLVVPLKNMGNMYGLLFLGPQLSGDDYTVDDMEFLTLLGETAAVGVDRAMSRRDYEKNTELLRTRADRQSRIFAVAREAAGVKNIDELYDLTAQHLRQDFGIDSFSVVLLNPRSQEYRLFGGNQISPASIARFRLAVDSELIGLISNLIRVYELPDFRENRELTSCYTNDDLALMESYWVVPLISLNWLVGFVTVHKTSEPWEEFQRELVVAAAEMLGPVYANAVILGERETLFRDPFSPLEGRLKLEIKKARDFQASVSLIEIRVKNIKRLMAANSPEAVAEFLSELGRATSGFLFESDFLARVGQGRFALVLPGRTGPEAEIFVKKLKAEFKHRRFLPGSPVDIQFVSSIISFPTDAEDAGKMLAMLD